VPEAVEGAGEPGWLITRSCSVTVWPFCVQLSSLMPPASFLRCATSNMRVRPKRPGSLKISTVRPAFVTPTMRTPGAPLALGHTKLVHDGAVLR